MEERRRGGGGMRLVLAIIIALISIGTYYSSTQKNEITGENQRVSLNPQQEMALGLQALPQMLQQFGGESNDREAVAMVEKVGRRLLDRSSAGKSGYQFDFHLLGDTRTINAFALPGGQVFITEALLRRLKSESAVAGVLGHEIGHVVGRHGAEHLAKQNLTQGLVGAVAVGADDARVAQVAAAVGQMINMKYGRDDELESDKLGVRFMAEAGYDPRGMVSVMETLAEAAKGARTPEFFSTHPNPENRIPRIKEAIKEKFPQGVPDNLDK